MNKTFLIYILINLIIISSLDIEYINTKKLINLLKFEINYLF